MTQTQHRKDIQGLRALAVLLVVAGHFFPGVVQGGFIGVDIFFVVSGFVITQQMLKSIELSHQRFLLNFYARRIRRILPSALLVTLVTIVVAKWLLGPVVANSTTLDGAWATVFLSNFHFQSIALDYFSSGTQVSPLQHYWSLSIEEQFYLVWPAIFLLLHIKSIAIKARKVVLTVIIAVSLFVALYQSTVTESAIFFSTLTRVWELAIGALLAILAISIRVPRILLNICIGALVVSAFVIPQSMQWPRLTTVPIVALTSLILMRNPRLDTSQPLENRAATYIGDLSYIIYLWHWPVLTIAKGYFGKFEAPQILVCLTLTMFLSVLTHHLFENPIRYSKKLISSAMLTVSLGISSVVTVGFVLFTTYQG